MGTIVSLTGPSGAGKTSIAQKLLQKLGNIYLITSFTTRAARHTDLAGEYRYISSQQDFEAMRSADEFLWTAAYAAAHYGTTAQSIKDSLNTPGFSLMILVPSIIPNLQSFLLSQKREKNYIPLFIISPDKEEVKRRLIRRGDNEQDILLRLEEGKHWEISARNYSSIPFRFIRNDRDGVDLAVEDIIKILRG